MPTTQKAQQIETMIVNTASPFWVDINDEL
jgi:hypothetical protein